MKANEYLNLLNSSLIKVKQELRDIQQNEEKSSYFNGYKTALAKIKPKTKPALLNFVRFLEPLVEQKIKEESVNLSNASSSQRRPRIASSLKTQGNQARRVRSASNLPVETYYHPMSRRELELLLSIPYYSKSMVLSSTTITQLKTYLDYIPASSEYMIDALDLLKCLKSGKDIAIENSDIELLNEFEQTAIKRSLAIKPLDPITVSFDPAEGHKFLFKNFLCALLGIVYPQSGYGEAARYSFHKFNYSAWKEGEINVGECKEQLAKYSSKHWLSRMPAFNQVINEKLDSLSQKKPTLVKDFLCELLMDERIKGDDRLLMLDILLVRAQGKAWNTQYQEGHKAIIETLVNDCWCMTLYGAAQEDISLFIPK